MAATNLQNLTRRARAAGLVTALLLLAVLVVAGNTWLAIRALQKLTSSQHLVEHTWQVISQVEIIMGSAKDAETGVRGFMITANPTYLAPYKSGKADLPRELDEFGRLTQDNPRQVARLISLRAVISERLALLQQGVDLRSAGRTDNLHSLGIAGDGKFEMDRLRGLADAAEAEEHRLLAQRTEEARVSSRHARQTFYLASGLDLLLILLLFRHVARERGLRLQTEEAVASLVLARADAERNAEEVRRLNVTLEERVQLRTAELESTNRELEAFSYSVSHDLRSPLRTIDGFSLALEEDYAELVDDVGRDYIRRVRLGVQRMGQLIDALLQLSRITRAEITRDQVDVSSLAEGVAANLRDEYPGNLRITIEPGMMAHADSRLLRVALENMMGNAAKFTSKISHPMIHVGYDVQKAAFFITDNGAGFDMTYAGRLFSAFNRLHGDKDFKGSGIGLATVARVISRHQGKVWAEAEVDRGATFYFTVG